jgi:hypothetical protein
MSATSAIAATVHGSAVERLADSRRSASAVPTAVPQAWQNRAPGESGLAHAAHRAFDTSAPQLEQYRPVAGAEHAGQVAVEVVADGMGER